MNADHVLSDTLRRKRRAAGLTLEQLAETSGVSARAISDMERGRSRGPQQRTIARIADALGLTGADRDQVLAAAAAGRAKQWSATPAPGATEPPRAVGDFVGRRTELAWLVAQARSAAGNGVALVNGPGGLGKTCLAVHAVNYLHADFPDGIHFVDLRGMAPQPMETGEALTRLMRAFGIAPGRIPAGLDERAGAYRQLLRVRRALIILDNAADEAQVRPLLTGEGPAFTIVTSRFSLAGIEDVRRLALGTMPAEDARRLLETILAGGGGVSGPADQASVAEVARLCGNLPLALRIAGNRLLSRPDWNIGDLLRRLDDEEHRLDQLAAGDLAVVSVFALSYRQLSATAATVFRRLSLVEGSDVGSALSVVVADLPGAAVAAALDELVDLGLLQSRSADRFHFHDLVRLYARQRLTEEETPAEVCRLHDRMADWLLRAASKAGRMFEPEPGVSEPAAHLHLTDTAQAQRWLQQEGDNWLAALRWAASTGRHRTVVEVADSMHWFSERWTFWPHWEQVFELARAAASELGDQAAEATHLGYLAWVYAVQGDQLHRALTVATESARVARIAGDQRRLAWALHYVADCHLMLEEFEEGVVAGTEAARLFVETGDDIGLSQALLGLGRALRRLGRVTEALAAHTRALALADDPGGSLRGQVALMTRSAAHAGIGVGLADLGRYDEAVEHLRAGVAAADALGVPSNIAETHLRLGRVLSLRGDTDEGQKELEHAAATFAAYGDEEKAGRARSEIRVTSLME